MENLLKIFSMLNNQSSNSKKDIQQAPERKIPKEILDQYPYGKFPDRYTKSGQENLRKNSENRYANEQTYLEINSEPKKEPDNINLSSLLPLIQLMSNKKQPADNMKLLTELLFKDNKEIKQLFNMFYKDKSQEIKNSSPFPDTNKVNISSLKRVE